MGQENKWTFEKRISIGHLLTAAMMLIVLFGGWVQLKTSIKHNSSRIEALEKADNRQEKEITRRLDSIDHKLDAHIDLHLNRGN